MRRLLRFAAWAVSTAALSLLFLRYFDIFWWLRR